MGKMSTCMDFMTIAMGLGCLKQKSDICDAFGHLAVPLIRQSMLFKKILLACDIECP